VFELERQTLPVLVVSHMSTLQVLMGFFYGSKRSVDSYYSLWIPQHTVLELIPHQYGWLEIRHDLSDEACADEYDWRHTGSGGSDSVKSSTRSLPGSPKNHPVPVELGTAANDEVERFNLQEVQPTRGDKQAPASHTKMPSDGTAPSVTASIDEFSTLSVSQPPRSLMLHDRSVSIPPQAQSTPSPSAANAQQQLPGFEFVARKGSIGKSSNVTVLGETDFYGEP
jgi:hypothetical protein